MQYKSLRFGIHNSWLFAAIFIFVSWLIFSFFPHTESYIPKPKGVIEVLYNNRDVLTKHLAVTSLSAFLGLFYAIILAGLTTWIVLFLPRTKRFFSLVSTIIYSIPLIAAAPLAALIFGTDQSGSVLGCLGAYLPIFLTGIKYSDRGSSYYSQMINSFGASKHGVTKYITLPLMLRGWVIGAQSGWIWAVLGALLGDFTGSRWGLGTFLIGSLVHGDPNKVFAIVVLCLLLSGTGLVLIKIVAKRFLIHDSFDSIDVMHPNGLKENKGGAIYDIICMVIFLSVWQLISWLANISGGVLSGPIDIFSISSEIYHSQSSVTFSGLFDALGSTWVLAFLGIILSIAIAFFVAVAYKLLPLLFSRPIVLVILITQVTPIVAFIPLIAYYFDRGAISVITIVILSTVYPSYVIFRKSFEAVPKDALDVARGFGASKFTAFIKISLPSAKWMSIVAFRLAISRGLLGAITAQYLLTGTGLGGMLGQTRAFLDFRLVWLICVLVAIATLITDALMNFSKNAIERRLVEYRVLLESKPKV